MAFIIDRNDMLLLRTKMCSLAERVAAGFQITLDYSDRSVGNVDRILGQLHDEYRRTKSNDGLKGIAIEFGAYLVTVLERHHGPVVWERDHKDFGADSFPVQWRGSTLFPVAWCLKRIIDGPGDDLVAKWQVLVLAHEKSETN